MVKKTVEIRVRATVEEGSIEEKLLEFLSDEDAIPYKKSEMWMKAAKMCWLSLALKYNKCSQDEIEESLYECDYSWELHWEFLLTKARMRLARIRHRVYCVNPLVRRADLEMEQADWDEGNLEKNSFPFSGKSDSRDISRQANNATATELRTNAGTDQSEDPDNNTVLNDEPTPKPFNLFGNSIISKQS